ncbi:MAG: HAD family hydrolase [Eubacterium sp.]|nr:HAD family hydrolase [Eubacterium sp.]
MKHYQLIIFDLDGTILDTLEDLMVSLNVALQKNKLSERSLEEVRSFVGNGIGMLIRRAVPADADEKMIRQVHTDFTDHYKDHSADHTRPYEGIPGLMKQLHENGHHVAVVSNKVDYAVQDLCRHYFPGLIDIAVGEKEGVRRKPEPDSVNEVIRLSGVSKESVVYIGDSEVDIRTAKNADIDAIIVEWGFRDRNFLIEQGASVLVKTPGELSALLL